MNNYEKEIESLKARIAVFEGGKEWPQPGYEYFLIDSDRTVYQSSAEKIREFFRGEK